MFSLYFSQSNSANCTVSAIKTIYIRPQADNNLPLMFYSE